MSEKRPLGFAWGVVMVGSVLAATPAWGQSIQTDGDIETAAQLVSTVETGTAPLVVSSTTVVPGLNADKVDGVEGTDLALDADLQNVEAMLVALQAQVDAAPVQLPETGQKTCWDAAGTEISCTGTGQDGDLRRGVEWPPQRFTDNGDGTVKDNLTGLIWLQDASCADLAGTDGDGKSNWTTALSAAAALASGICGLTDGSAAGAWRLPNRFELESLLDMEFHTPALSDAAGTAKWTTDGDAFSGIPGDPLDYYWSSTTLDYDTTYAWYVYFDSGYVLGNVKSTSYFVWPVRGGQ